MSEPPRQDTPPAPGSTLDPLLRRSAAALLMERAWRAAAALSTLGLLFLTLSWLGLWVDAGAASRMAGVALFGAAGGFIILREMARGWPRRRAALARLDMQGDPRLRPAVSLDDTLAGRDPDPATAALWTLHRRRLEQTLATTPIAPPAPRVDRRDPYALRALALVAAVAASFVAGDDKGARLRAAFDWRAGGGAGGQSARIDAWLDPPPYTGRPPIVLAAKPSGPQETISAPVNSILHVRPFADGVATEGALVAVEAAPQATPSAAPVEREKAFTLAGAARLALPDGRSFEIAAIPDAPPTIALTQEPRNNTRGSMTLAFRAQDDYGAVSA